MFLIITSIVGFLIVVNFLLLVFSCNKTTKRKMVTKANKVPVIVRNTYVDENKIELAPTGS